jgi:D-alanyl-D-alanine carboxypeptidase/D-alanyl-D-alanine-endopeptidase (penicillin-binding protein 4)
MKRHARALAIPAILLSAWLCPLAARAADLDGEISTVLHDKLLAKAEESIEIVRLGNVPADGKLLFRHNSDIPLIPASNLKVITTSAALDRLGPDFKFRTQLVWHDNDLILIGDGDPTFGDAELLSRVGWDVNTVFKNWGEALKKMSLPPVRNVVVDDSIFEETTLHPRWPVDQVQKRYMAEVAGMNLNANCLDVFVRTSSPGEIVGYILNPDTHYVNFQNTCVTGNENAVWLSRVAETNNVIMRGQAAVSTNVPVSVTIHEPAMFAATVLAENLTNAGVEHSGDVHRDRTVRDQLKKAQASGDKSWVVLAVHETPIERVMARANKDSMNLYAECLCKRLGADVSGQSGSWQNGPAAVGEFLKKVGVADSEFKLDDGCGLSKQNVISASAMVKTLTYDFFSPNSHLFAGTLAVAGVDGTLDDRFRGTDLKARVFGKSGFVNGVSSLSGYLHAKDGQWYAFSILMNGIPAQSNSAIKFLQEKIVRAVDSSTAAVASLEH